MSFHTKDSRYNLFQSGFFPVSFHCLIPQVPLSSAHLIGWQRFVINTNKNKNFQVLSISQAFIWIKNVWKIQSYFNFYDGTWCLWFCNVHAAAYIVSLFALLTAELRLRVIFFALWWFSKFTRSFIYTLNNVYSVVRQYNAFKLHNSKLKQKWILSLKSSAKLDNLHKLYNFF